MEFWIWIVIMIVVALAKGLGKVTGEDQEPGEPPPVAPARRVRPRGRRRPHHPAARPAPSREVPPLVRPARQPKRPWQVPVDDLQEFLERLENASKPAPPPVVEQPVVQQVIPPVAAAVAASPPASTTRPSAPPRTSRPLDTRASRWAEALRDRQNIRNIIIASEIIGPPKSLAP